MRESQTVSVAMCTYNGARFLQQQLDSIASQTSLPDELVICDDGSTDDTSAIVQNFAAAVSFPVRFITNEERLRFAGNFAKCIGLCTGTVIVLTDQDDIWVRTRIEDTREAYAKQDTLLFTFSDAELIDETGKKTGERIYSNFPIHRRDRRRVTEGRNLFSAIARWGFIYGCTMSFRADMRRVVLPIPHGWSHDEWISLALSSLGPSAKLRPQTLYRQHGVNSVGVGDWSAAGKMRMAKSRNADAYEAEIVHVLRGYAAAQANEHLRINLAPTLERKAAFLAERNAARKKKLLGLGKLGKVIAGGGYKHYSAGPKSLLKDLAIMVGVMS